MELVDVSVHLEAVCPREPARVDPWPGDHDHAKSGNEPLRLRERCDSALEQVHARSGSARGDDADLLVRAVAERLPITEVARLEAGDVPGERKALVRPLGNRRKAGA